MPLAAFLVAMVGPLVARLIVALGITLTVTTGLAVAVGTVKSYVTTGIASTAATAVALGGQMGLWQCLGMIFGTVTFLLAWKGTSGFISLAKA